MEQASFNEFKITGIDKTIENNLVFGTTDNPFDSFHSDESLTAQRRRSYLMEMNEDFDIQQVFKDISWNQRTTE